jgi:serine/threonine protein kinase
MGRRDIYALWNENEQTISTHHLRFRCVMYESDEDQKVSPMVYVRVLSSNYVQLSRSGEKNCNRRHQLRKSDPDLLLNDGDVLYLTPAVSATFRSLGHYTAPSGNLNPIQAVEIRCFDDRFYVTDRTLGAGGNASVFVAVKQSTQRQVACKIVPVPDPVNKRKLQKLCQDQVREYSVLKNLDHPNIITLEKVIRATNNTYIFQELITGGDLLSYVDRKGALGEAETAVIIRQVLKAIDYLHDNGVVHRDIKPENILMTSWREGSRIVLTDFGQSRTLEEAEAAVRKSAALRMHSIVGTVGYTAPEVFNQINRELRDKGYSKAIDIWSIGCLTAKVLTNNLIFADEATESLGELADPDAEGSSQRWNLNIMDRGAAWTSVGRKAKSFIRGCLVLNESERLTAKQAPLHPWFTNRHYAEDLEAAYKRAIQEWSPRTYDGNLVEVIDTSDAALKATAASGRATTATELVKSQYFDSLPPPPKPSLFFQSAAAMPQQFAYNQPALTTQFEDTERETVPVLELAGPERRHGRVQWTARQPQLDYPMYICGQPTSDNLQHSPNLLEDM